QTLRARRVLSGGRCPGIFSGRPFGSSLFCRSEARALLWRGVSVRFTSVLNQTLGSRNLPGAGATCDGTARSGRTDSRQTIPPTGAELCGDRAVAQPVFSFEAG